MDQLIQDIQLNISSPLFEKDRKVRRSYQSGRCTEEHFHCVRCKLSYVEHNCCHHTGGEENPLSGETDICLYTYQMLHPRH